MLEQFDLRISGLQENHRIFSVESIDYKSKIDLKKGNRTVELPVFSMTSFNSFVTNFSKILI